MKANYTKISKEYDIAVAKWYDQSESQSCENPNSAKFYGYANHKLKSRSYIPPLTYVFRSATLKLDIFFYD